MPHADIAVERPTDLTAEWLAGVLGVDEVTQFDCDRIGTGQMSECYRVTLAYPDGHSGPASVILKLAASDPTSRQTGRALGLYDREVRFYAEIAPRLNGPVARCYHAAYDPGTGAFDLVLNDATPAHPGDEIRGATIDQSLLAIGELGRMQGPLLDDPALAELGWLTQQSPGGQALIASLYEVFTDRYAEAMTPDQRRICERLVNDFDTYLSTARAPGQPMGLVHGDYRLDNLLFGAPGAAPPLTVVDWQTVSWAPALTDLAYFIGGALPVAVRRQHYDKLLGIYLEALGPRAGFELNDIREGVRRQALFGVLMAITSSVAVARTARGDTMFMTMFERHCSHAMDTDAIGLLPSPVRRIPLRPSERDEATHIVGDQPLWNESWYFDFADPAQGFGGWLRIGLYPNEKRAWINVVLCGPGMPTVALNDFEAALPADPNDVHAGHIDFAHCANDPLRTYTVTVTGRGEAHDDPAALLRREPGAPVQAELRLVWQTDGLPYQYRLGTRYEIPCRVSGSVTVDGKTYALDGVPGQRDHSWGVRDWWSADWMWSALHLDDGTHVHAVDVRMAGMPAIGIGYHQSAGAALVELDAVQATETIATNGLPTAAQLRLQPGGLALEVTARGHAPVPLIADDGRVSEFPRAWVTVSTDDGRNGVGWIEWNRNIRPVD